MSTYVLYGHPDSGHSFKARLALVLLGLPHEYRRVDIFSARDDRPEDFRRASRFNEVPALIVDGRPLVQSDAILLHLAREHRALGWEIDPDRLTEWLFWEANRIGISLPNWRYHTLFEPTLAPETLAWLRNRLDADLNRLDSELADRPFLMGQGVSAADIACSAYLNFADQLALDLQPWPNVVAWLDRIRALPGWAHPRDLMKG